MSPTMRDEFPKDVREILAKRVALQCSRPGCGRVTSGPTADPKKSVSLGVAAHITAAAPGGPRYDQTLTPAQRRSHENGLWLCQTCAKLVDNDPVKYTVETLREWKASAEARATRDLESGAATAGIASAAFKRLERLIPDLLEEMRQDLAQYPLRRNCVLLEKGWTYNGEGTELVYYFDEHPELENQFRILENYGLVVDITTGDVTKYRLSEDLVQYLGVA